MSETVYIHRAPEEGADGPVGVVFTTHGAAVVYTGLEVHTEKDAPLLEEIEALCGLTFFRREQDLPLYGVPCLYVFAADGAGGVLACAGDEEGPVYHIPPSLLPHLAAPSIAALLETASADPDWREKCLAGGPWPRLPAAPEGRTAIRQALGLPRPERPAAPAVPPRVFPSRAAAERVYPIQEMEELLVRTPRFQVRPMTSPADRTGKAYVHYTAWIEAYTGLMDQKILDGHSLEHCRDITEKYPSNTLVLLDRDQGGRVAGFACFVPKARDFVSVPEAAEISALYLLSAYHGLGLGRMLMDACLARLDRPRVALFVLQGNEKAIGFYQHMGFSMTGHQLTDRINGVEITELEMVLDRDV